jgi:TPR repeat protein
MPNKLVVFFSFVFLVITPAYAASPKQPNSVPLDQNSLQILIEKANNGDTNAQLNLGRCYWKGQGIAQDYKEAVKWFTKAAEQGNADAQYILGIMFYNGQSVKQDYKEAVKWLTKAAEQGNVDAMRGLGNIYQTGRGLPQSDSEAIKWFKKAQEQENADAKRSIEQQKADIQHSIEQEKADNQRNIDQKKAALQRYKEVAEQGDTEAQYNLGIMYYYQKDEVTEGHDITQDHKEAAKWFCESLKKSIPLDKGIYGIPFNATIDEVLIWCKDNNMAIANDTEQTIAKDLREKASRIKRLKKAYEDDKQYLPALEQEILDIMKSNGSDPTISALDDIEKKNIEAIQVRLETLKNPWFSYAGEKYYLSSIFPNGLKMWVDGKPQFCKNPEITKTAFSLILKPTKDSERMINNGLKQLTISFFGSQGQSPKTFATLAYFSDSPNKSLQAQFDFISKAISEKYGSPKLFNFDDFMRQNEDLHTIIYDDMFLLTGEKWSDYSSITFLMWARNIRLLGEIGYWWPVENEISLKNGCDTFGLLYYEPNAFMRLSENRNKAVKNFEEEYYKQRKQESAKMREDF